MQTVFLAGLLALVFSFFSQTAQNRLRSVLERRPRWIWAVPFLLTAIVAAATLLVGAFSLPFVLMVFAYTLAPVLCVTLAGSKPPHWLDFVAILLLWFPIEFAAGGSLVPAAVHGFLHSVAYGIAILLGLILFLGYRRLSGMKFNLPQSRRDYWLPLAGFALCAPILVVVGVAIGFIPPPHVPVQPAGKMAAAAGIIFAATALPEEILFRALIQNLLMQALGSNWRVLLLASVIFGLAHLDNGPQPVPNWRYAILATIAGLAYGKVFDTGNTIVSSAALHAMVDWTKHFFF